MKKKSGTSKQNNVVIKIKMCRGKKKRKKEWSKQVKWKKREKNKEARARITYLGEEKKEKRER